MKKAKRILASVIATILAIAVTLGAGPQPAFAAAEPSASQNHIVNPPHGNADSCVFDLCDCRLLRIAGPGTA